MKEKFLKQLNYRLGNIKKKERIKYIENYSEIIKDKLEEGESEEDVIIGLGSVASISKEIHASYSEEQLQMNKLEIFWRYYNKLYLIIDILIVVISVLIGYITFYDVIMKGVLIGERNNPIWFLLLIPLYKEAYYLSGQYRIDNKIPLIRSLLFMVIISVIIIAIVVILLDILNFYMTSRGVLSLIVIVNALLFSIKQMIIRIME